MSCSVILFPYCHFCMLHTCIASIRGAMPVKVKVYRYNLLNENNDYKIIEGEQCEWQT